MTGFLGSVRKFVFKNCLPLAAPQSIGMLAVSCFGLIGCAPSAVLAGDLPSTVLGVTGGVFGVLSLVYLGSHSKAFASELIGPALGPPGIKLSGWLKTNGQELLFMFVVLAALLLFSTQGWAQVRIPGSDESAKLKAAGTLLMLIDTALFVWLARIFAGLCVLSAGWLIKEQKFGPAVVCVLGALIIGTSPMWVQNIFEISGGGGVFK